MDISIMGRSDSGHRIFNQLKVQLCDFVVLLFVSVAMFIGRRLHHFATGDLTSYLAA